MKGLGFGTQVRIPKADHESTRSLQQSQHSKNNNPTTSHTTRNLAETIYGTEVILGD